MDNDERLLGRYNRPRRNWLGLLGSGQDALGLDVTPDRATRYSRSYSGFELF
jgi:hypothetical protein